MDTYQPTTGIDGTSSNPDPLSAENFDPMTYEDLLPYLLLPVAGGW